MLSIERHLTESGLIRNEWPVLLAALAGFYAGQSVRDGKRDLQLGVRIVCAGVETGALGGAHCENLAEWADKLNNSQKQRTA